MALLTRCFQEAIRKWGFLKKGSSSKSKIVEKNNNNNTYGWYKYEKKYHFIKYCSLWELEWKKNSSDKGKQQKKDRVPRRRVTNKAMDKIIKRAMAAMQSSNDESDNDDRSEDEDQPLMAKEDSDTESEDLLALMENPDFNVDKEEELEVSFQDIKDKIHTYSKNKLISLLGVLIDAYLKISDEKEQLMNDYALLRLEHNDLEISRENLEVFVVHLKDQIFVLEDEKSGLETENNKFLYAPNIGKDLATDIHEKLESELKEANNKLLVESEKDRILQENLDKTNFELENNLKWTRSSQIIIKMHENHSNNKKGLGHTKAKTPYNPHSKYTDIPDNPTKDGIFDMFVTFVKKQQRKINSHVASKRSSHRTEFENVNFLEFCGRYDTQVADDGEFGTVENNEEQTNHELLKAAAEQKQKPCPIEIVQDISKIWGTIQENQEESIAPGSSAEHEGNTGIQGSHTRGWKHQSSYPLTNVLTLVDSRMVTRSKFRNMIALSSYISMVESKNIKEALGDVDWIVGMQEELNQLERNKIWHLVPSLKDRIVIGTSLDMDEPGTLVDEKKYRDMIGSLLYLTANEAANENLNGGGGGVGIQENIVESSKLVAEKEGEEIADDVSKEKPEEIVGEPRESVNARVETPEALEQ
ncbi:uncharacterized protein [Nicotiana tomentosiformis]|uniref:uncharacterized protein n=1 Tax=Nicotiana tomentosiformis TaxID=4098 RepID=UPI00388CD024